MIIKVLGVMDIFIALVFWIFGIFHIVPDNFVMILGLFLLVKGIIFLTGLSVASIFDILSAGLIILATYITMPKFIVIIVSLYLIQKGVFSLLS